MMYMKVGDKVYYVENRQAVKAEIIKLTRDFVTLRFRYRDPNSSPGHDVYNYGGLRLRINKVFETKEEAEAAIKQ